MHYRRRQLPGAYVIKQGEEGNRFYLVEDGELVAQKSTGSGDPQEVLAYKRGDYFGELALLHDDVRAASVMAKTEANVLWIDRKTFKGVLGSLEDTMKTKASQYA